MESFEKDGKWGLKDDNGNVIIQPKYDAIHPGFEEGLIGVKLIFPVGNVGAYVNKWGFLNRNGQVVIPFEYDWAGPFYDGRACIRLKHEESNSTIIKKYGYIDHSGKIVIPVKYDEAGGFWNYGTEVITAKVKLNGEHFEIDKWGNRVK
jgi:hypothetical protein